MPMAAVNPSESMQHKVEEEVAHILRKTEPFVSFGSGTNIARNGKITTQTFAVYFPSDA